MPAQYEYQTAHCRIRPATIDDFLALERAVGSSAFPQDLPLARLLKAGKLLQWLAASCRDSVEPKLWSITTPSSQVCIGQLGLFPEATPGTGWLSYWVDPAYWGRGIAKECIAKLLQEQTTNDEYRVVIAAVAASNLRSVAVLRGLGFQQTAQGITRSPIPAGHLCFILHLGAADAAST